MVLNTAELRAKAFEDLHIAMHAKPIANPTPGTIKIIYAAQYNKLAGLTDQFILTVDEGIALTKKIDTMLRAALKQQFPDQEFLQVDFESKPESQVLK